jgi:hypothetical protein
MNNLSSSLLSGLAQITANGIFFNERYYTCKLAIKEKWFNLISTKIVKEMMIFYDTNDLDHILLLLENGNLEKANSIESQSYILQKLNQFEEYFSEMNKLKKRFKHKKKRPR